MNNERNSDVLKRLKKMDRAISTLQWIIIFFSLFFLIALWNELSKFSIGCLVFAIGFGLSNIMSNRLLGKAHEGWDKTLNLCGELVDFNSELIDENIMLRKKLLKEGGKNDRTRQSKGSSRKS